MVYNFLPEKHQLMIKQGPFFAGELVSISKDIIVEIWGKLWLLIHWFFPFLKKPSCICLTI